MSEPKLIGNAELLKKPITGFFSSRTTAPRSVMLTLDWAQEVARDADAVVMSGFQSSMEREVLDILLTGRCAIIYVLNRSLYRTIPPQLKAAINANRLLLVSLCSDRSVRPSAQQALARNRYIADVADSLVFSSVSENSSLYPLFQEYENKITYRL